MNSIPPKKQRKKTPIKVNNKYLLLLIAYFGISQKPKIKTKQRETITETGISITYSNKVFSLKT
jgi:hypothetical protein